MGGLAVDGRNGRSVKTWLHVGQRGMAGAREVPWLVRDEEVQIIILVQLRD